MIQNGGNIDLNIQYEELNILMRLNYQQRCRKMNVQVCRLHMKERAELTTPASQQ